MKKILYKTISLLFLASVLVACTQSPAARTSPTPAGSTNQPQIPQATSTPDIIDTRVPTKPVITSQPAKQGETMNELVIQAKTDLAERLLIEADQIELIQFKAVVWPDSSLGCPQPGMAYAEVITPGYLIILYADNKEYEYHASKGTLVIYCENPTPPIPGMPEDI